jgi:site-specific DNA-methyltransferase (adenine-specific)
MDYKSLGINDINPDKCWGISWAKSIGKQCPFNKKEGNYCNKHIKCLDCGDIYNVVENPLLKKTKEPHTWKVNKNSDKNSDKSDSDSVSSDNSNSIDEMLSADSEICDNIDVEISEDDNNNEESDVNDDDNEGNEEDYHIPVFGNINIYNDDCLKGLSILCDNYIDCVITDPPYFIDKLDENWSAKNINNDVKNSHINHLPKGMKFDKSQVKSLYDYYLILSKLLFKKMKPGAYFLSFSSPRLYHSIAMACEIAGFEIRDMINWNYTQTMPKGMSMTHIIKKMDIPDEEKMKLIEEYKEFKTPQIRSCFEPICVAMKPINTTFIKNELNFKTGLIDFSQKVGIDNNRIPANIITTEKYNDIYDKNFLVSKPTKKEKGDGNTHITVKPISLMEHLIKLFSKKESLVVDPFLGSGTTAVACKNTDRRCIGYELNKEYYEICKSRCNI